MQSYQRQYGPTYKKQRATMETLLYSRPEALAEAQAHFQNGQLDPTYARVINQRAKNPRAAEILTDALRDRGMM
jgi:hypothetical protein